LLLLLLLSLFSNSKTRRAPWPIFSSADCSGDDGVLGLANGHHHMTIDLAMFILRFIRFTNGIVTIHSSNKISILFCFFFLSKQLLLHSVQVRTGNHSSIKSPADGD